jgi:carbonic anhydrase/acetyltransferase-like protein (isoleucine patch superfamily)
MAIYALNDKQPTVAEGAWVADSAQVMGAVELGVNASVWFGTVIRGDTETIRIGEGTNIGAATIFVNYDGVEKHHTTIGDHVRIGSDSMLVAPVSIGDGAYTAAGSVITEDVPPGAMGVARGKQRNVIGWVMRKRSGTQSAEAAARHNDEKKG